MKIYHRGRLPWRWDMPVELFHIRHNFGEVQSAWGWGAVYFILIPYPHQDPFLANKRRIVYNERFYR